MIGYVRGIVTHLFRDACFVDVHGVGYKVYVPASTLDILTMNREATLYTYMHVREDAIVLYGFSTQDEYDLFMLLIGVNGVGPKVALGILSSASPDGFRLAVRRKDMKVLTHMPGIGKKTAERIILELYDKVAAAEEDDAAAGGSIYGSGAPQGIVSEGLAALTGLGYTAQEVMPVIEAWAPQCATVEELLKAVLKALGSRR